MIKKLHVQFELILYWAGLNTALIFYSCLLLLTAAVYGKYVEYTYCL